MDCSPASTSIPDRIFNSCYSLSPSTGHLMRGGHECSRSKSQAQTLQTWSSFHGGSHIWISPDGWRKLCVEVCRRLWLAFVFRDWLWIVRCCLSLNIRLWVPPSYTSFPIQSAHKQTGKHSCHRVPFTQKAWSPWKFEIECCQQWTLDRSWKSSLS